MAASYVPPPQPMPSAAQMSYAAPAAPQQSQTYSQTAAAFPTQAPPSTYGAATTASYGGSYQTSCAAPAQANYSTMAYPAQGGAQQYYAGSAQQQNGKQMKDLFDMLDKNHDGKISREEFNAAMQESSCSVQ